MNKFLKIILNNQIRKRGFVILIAVTLASIMLSISLGVVNIMTREMKFGTNARAANDAFFAADSGAECGLFNDRTTGSSFPIGGPAGTVSCATGAVTMSGDSNIRYYDFIVANLGSGGVSCAHVNIKKDGIISPPYVMTTLVSKGYNIGGSNNLCDSDNPNRIEREVKISY